MRAQTGSIFPQRRAFAESGAANAVFRYDPSGEKANLENPQIFQICEIINNSSAEYAQSETEGISNRLFAARIVRLFHFFTPKS